MLFNHECLTSTLSAIPNSTGSRWSPQLPQWWSHSCFCYTLPGRTTLSSLLSRLLLRSLKEIRPSMYSDMPFSYRSWKSNDKSLSELSKLLLFDLDSSKTQHKAWQLFPQFPTITQCWVFLCSSALNRNSKTPLTPAEINFEHLMEHSYEIDSGSILSFLLTFHCYFIPRLSYLLALSQLWNSWVYIRLLLRWRNLGNHG